MTKSEFEPELLEQVMLQAEARKAWNSWKGRELIVGAYYGQHLQQRLDPAHPRLERRRRALDRQVRREHVHAAIVPQPSGWPAMTDHARLAPWAAIFALPTGRTVLHARRLPSKHCAQSTK
jgi:hypothetical protein